jgi:hypothetical protein
MISLTYRFESVPSRWYSCKKEGLINQLTHFFYTDSVFGVEAMIDTGCTLMFYFTRKVLPVIHSKSIPILLVSPIPLLTCLGYPKQSTEGALMIGKLAFISGLFLWFPLTPVRFTVPVYQMCLVGYFYPTSAAVRIGSPKIFRPSFQN